MSKQSGTIDYWRKYFESANGDIFEVLQQAIVVAASDCPNEFRIRRDEIAEKLFTCRLPRCVGCDGLDLPVPEEERVDVVKDNSDGRVGFEDVGGRESKGACSTNINSEIDDTKVSNISYHEAEALTDMLEEENLMIEEVFRIKEILVNSIDQSSTALFESLRRLELMDITMQTLLTTNIGNAVSALRKHQIKEISKLARSLVKSWKSLISEWVATSEAAKRSNDSPGSVNPSPASVNPSVIDEEEFGLPSPPLDEGVFFAPETTSMELSKFFDGMDDDGNIDYGRIDGENERKSVSERRNVQKENNNIQKRRAQFPQEQNMLPKDNKNQSMVKQETVIKQTKPSSTDSGFRKPSKLGLEQQPNNEVKLRQNLDTTRTERKPVSGQPDKPKPSGVLLDQKLEIAKRKLHQGYQQAENAKKQRTIQVMDLHDLPKQSLGSNSRNTHVRPGSQNRSWSNGRR